MEKISNIVRGSARVASTDMAAAPAVRPGAPTFGRPVGESPASTNRFDSTASRATALHNEMLEHKRNMNQDHASEQMADQFFASRVRRPEEEAPMQAQQPQPTKAKASVASTGPAPLEAQSTDELMLEETRNAEVSPPPSGFKPRGSYVDVRV